MAMESWVGKVKHIALTTENSRQDYVIVALSNAQQRAPKWYTLELGRRTPSALAQLNLLRDAMSRNKSVRLWVDRDDRGEDWREALIRSVEYPVIPGQRPRFLEAREIVGGGGSPP